MPDDGAISLAREGIIEDAKAHPMTTDEIKARGMFKNAAARDTWLALKKKTDENPAGVLEVVGRIRGKGRPRDLLMHVRRDGAPKADNGRHEHLGTLAWFAVKAALTDAECARWKPHGSRIARAS